MRAASKILSVVSAASVALMPLTADAANVGTNVWDTHDIHAGYIEEHAECCCHWVAATKHTYTKVIKGEWEPDPDAPWWQIGPMKRDWLGFEVWSNYELGPHQDVFYEKKSPDDPCVAPLVVFDLN